MNLGRALHSALCLLALAGAACAGEIVGKVVRVSDGDTLTVLIESQQVRIRLAEIDAPELGGQPFGRRSAQSLGKLCVGQLARVAEQGKDRYGRTLGRVNCAGIDANAEQVRRGWAWVYRRYAAKDSPLYRLEGEAREARIGLWADDSPIAPWDWRGRP